MSVAVLPIGGVKAAAPIIRFSQLGQTVLQNDWWLSRRRHEVCVGVFAWSKQKLQDCIHSDKVPESCTISHHLPCPSEDAGLEALEEALEMLPKVPSFIHSKSC